jgi:peptide deformylase
MAVLQVLKFPNPVLKKKSQQVTQFDAGLRKLADAMLETMYEEGGIGLAAVQVGQLKRLIVVDVRDAGGEEEMERRNPAAYVNPRILESSGEMVTEEGCLSVVEFTAEVKRAERVVLEYETLAGETRRETLTEVKAVCVQHEIDHTHGKLFVDHLPPVKRQLVKKRLAKLARTA